MSVLIASYDGTPGTDYNVVTNAGTVQSAGEIFVNTQSFVLESASMYLKRIGTPAGNVGLALAPAIGTVGVNAIPSNTPTAVTNTANVLAIATTYTLYNFTFTTTPVVTPGNYAIVALGDGFSGLGANLLQTPGVGSNAYAGQATYRSGATWFAQPSDDIFFYLYASSVIPDQITAPPTLPVLRRKTQYTAPEFAIPPTALQLAEQITPDKFIGNQPNVLFDKSRQQYSYPHSSYVRFIEYPDQHGLAYDSQYLPQLRHKPRLQYTYPSLFYRNPGFGFTPCPDPLAWVGDSVDPAAWSGDNPDPAAWAPVDGPIGPTQWRNCGGSEEDV